MRELTLKLGLVILGLAWTSQPCSAQGGYNYIRPRDDLGPAPGVGGVVTPRTLATAPSLRPLVTGLPPTATTGLGGIFPVTAPTNFGGGVGDAAAGFAQRPLGGIAGSAGYAGGGGGQRTALAQSRPTLGIYGPGQGQGQYSGGSATASGRGATTTGGGAGGDDGVGDYSAIPGTPGLDYPIFAQVPQTNFNCVQQPLPGYYADVEALCQVFHICALNRTYSFLCPNGTLFSQATLVCVWWNQADCAGAPSLYANNAFIYDYGGEVGANSLVGGGGYSTFGSRQSPAAAAAGRAAGTVTGPTSPAGIFGGGLVRPGGVSGSAFGGIQASSGGVGSPASYPGQGTAGLVGGGVGVGQRQPFASAAPTGKASPFVGLTAGGAAGPTGGGGVGGLREAAFGGGATTAAANQREYLPPRRP